MGRSGDKKFFQPFGPQFGLEINGRRPGPPGPPCRCPGSATEQSVWGTPPRPRQVCPGWRLGWGLLKINKKQYIYIYIYISFCLRNCCSRSIGLYASGSSHILYKKIMINLSLQYRFSNFHKCSILTVQFVES